MGDIAQFILDLAGWGIKSAVGESRKKDQEDRAHMESLVNFAVAQGHPTTLEQMKPTLSKQGWTDERIDLVISEAGLKGIEKNIAEFQPPTQVPQPPGHQALIEEYGVKPIATPEAPAGWIQKQKIDQAQMEGQAIIDAGRTYRDIIATNPKIDPDEAKFKMLEHIEGTYGFIPPTEKLKQVIPDVEVARDRKWFTDYFTIRTGFLKTLTNGNPEAATPQQKNLAATFAVQALSMEGHTPDIPEARALIFGDALGVAGNFDPKLKTELAAQGIDPNIASSSQIRTAIATMTERNLQTKFRGAKGVKAAGIAIDAAKEVGPALTILSEINDVLFGKVLPEDMNLPEGQQRRRTASLLQERGGTERFIHGLTRHGQAFWQDSEIGKRAALYKRVRKAFLAKIVRAFGEKGTLNEGDIQRMIELMPTLFTVESVARASMNMMEDILTDISTRTQKLSDALTVQQGMDLVEKLERDVFGEEVERATGQKLTPEELDDLRPADIIELDSDGNIISGEIRR